MEKVKCERTRSMTRSERGRDVRKHFLLICAKDIQEEQTQNEQGWLSVGVGRTGAGRGEGGGRASPERQFI